MKGSLGYKRLGTTTLQDTVPRLSALNVVFALYSYFNRLFSSLSSKVFVVDSSDSRHLEEASYCLVKVLSSPFLKGLPLLILANKQDVENAKDLEEVIRKYL